MTVTTKRIGGRFASLDGLRGVAALVVLVHHTSLFYPGFIATYWGGPYAPHYGSLTWWLSYSPLKLFTAGGEAVMVFFVLSGFVLALPVLKPGGTDWMGYYPQRLARICLPVVASLVVAAGLAVLVAQVPHAGISDWVAAHSVHPVDWKHLLRSFDVLSQDFVLNNPLWSIFWELVFSMMLPVFVGLAIYLRERWLLLISGAVILTFVGLHVNALGFAYLPAFMMGTLAAVLLPRIRDLGAKISAWRLGHVVWLTVLVASALLLIDTWLTGPLPASQGVLLHALGALKPVAALGILICCLVWEPLARLLATTPFRWAGTIAFSLYLVHAPILITLRYLLDGLPLPIIMASAIVASIGVAVLFYWAVEKRAHLLSRRIGRALSLAYADRQAGALASHEPGSLPPTSPNLRAPIIPIIPEPDKATL